MANQGQVIFENRVEYPLPKRVGVRDYLFYFVGAGDGYGKGARYFFDKFYPHHARRDAGSLEDVIAHLHAEVTEQGIQQIREIVIVAHGTPAGLLRPVVEDVTATNLPEFTHITPFSLACLQRDIAAGKFASLRDRRKKVLAHLKDDSWVTIRACNFGKSNPGMYALYSFFGGRANVYAPMEYQFFGTHPIMDGMRLDTKLRVHEHLVKQHYLPKDTHTPERKDAIVRAFVDPGQFSEPFVLATVGVESPDPTEAAPYETLVGDLNARRAGDALRTRFSEQGFALTRHPKVQVLVKDASWLIRDVLAHEGSTFPVEYGVNEEVVHEGSRQVAKLTAGARLVKVHSASEYFPLQLFFSEHQNESWRGKLFTLGFHSEEAEADPKHRQKFEAFQGLLTRGEFADAAGNDIRAAFKTEQGIDLSAQARIREVSKVGTAPRVRITWAIEDATSYLVRLEHPDTTNGIPVHTLTVYENPDRASVLRRQYELMATLGSDPDPHHLEGLREDVVRGAMAKSLERLGVDGVDLYWAHVEDPTVPVENLVETFGGLVRDGLTARWGLSNHPSWLLERIRATAEHAGHPQPSAYQQRYSYLQPAGGMAVEGQPIPLGMLSPDGLDFLRRNPSFDGWVYTATLQGRYDRNDRPLETEYRHPGTERRLAALTRVATARGLRPGQVALAWLASGSPALTPIVGASSVKQVEQAVVGASTILTEDELAALDGA